VQALDARTGEPIWENHIGPDISGGLGAIRSLAIYQDKIYLATTDVRLVALDARTGKQVWETRIADVSKGYSNTSGPLVIQGKVLQGMADATGTKKPAVTSAHMTRRPANSSGSSRPWRAKERPAATPGASCPIYCARAATRGSPAVTIPSSI
jgi:glucose dehydrogenase